jgi:ABC-2 type transport system permease protein
MQWISKLLPPSYVFENLRALVTGGQASQSSLVIGLAIASVELLLACYFFARTHRFAVRTGLIARYSAETVS